MTVTKLWTAGGPDKPMVRRRYDTDRQDEIGAWRGADGVTPTGTGVVVRHPQTGVCELWRTPAVLTGL